MEPIKIKIKRCHPEAVIPSMAYANDAAFDLKCVDDGVVSSDGRYIEYDTGIAVQPPDGYYTELFARSSISKYDLILCNGVGIIDQGYLSSIKVRFRLTRSLVFSNKYTIGQETRYYVKGDTIAQLVLRKSLPVEIVEVEELSETERGHSGFGSSGN